MPWRNDPESRRRSAETYDSPEYRRARLACLKAAKWRCQIRLEGCQGAASQTDHTDQAANDPHHRKLRATCGSCHRKVTSQQGNDARYRGPADPKPQPLAWWNDSGSTSF